MTQLLKNNVSGLLASQLNAGSTSMVLSDASNFPAPGADHYLVTLIGLNGNGQEASWEIVKVTAKASNTLTVQRAQESTTDATWPATTLVQMRLTAGTLGTKQDTLVSGTSIKTVNGNSLLGSGNLAVGDVLLGSSNTLTGSNVFGNSTGQLFLASTTTTQDGILIKGRAGGTNSYRVTVAPGTLTGNRAVTMPDAAGTLVLDTATQTLTNKTLTTPVISGQAATAGSLFYVSGELGFHNGSTYRGVVTTEGVQNLNDKSLNNPTFAGNVYCNGSYRSNIVAMGALQIDCSLGNYFTKTINANSTFTFTNVPASRAYGFTLELTHTSGTLTWPAAVKWPGDTAPSLTTGKTHLFSFVTDDGGTRWRGVAVVDYVN